MQNFGRFLTTADFDREYLCLDVVLTLVYRDMSIKDTQRSNRASATGIQFNNITTGTGHKIQQWRKFICSPAKKTAVIRFLVEQWKSGRAHSRERNLWRMFSMCLRAVPIGKTPNQIPTRKLCYRKDDRAMRPIHGCPENFRDSLTTPTGIISNIFHTDGVANIYI